MDVPNPGEGHTSAGGGEARRQKPRRKMPSILPGKKEKKRSKTCIEKQTQLKKKKFHPEGQKETRQTVTD